MTMDGNEMGRKNSTRMFIVLCCVCGKKRGMDGAWLKHDGVPAPSDTVVHSHGICPECSGVLYEINAELGGGGSSRSEA